MARSVGDVASQARQLLQDSNNAPTGGFRYTDAQMAFAINDGLSEMRRLRPDLFLSYGLDVALPVYTTADANATVLPISDSYFVALVNHVVARLSLREDEFSNDGRAVALLQAFSTSLTANGGKP